MLKNLTVHLEYDPGGTMIKYLRADIVPFMASIQVEYFKNSRYLIPQTNRCLYVWNSIECNEPSVHTSQHKLIVQHNQPIDYCRQDPKKVGHRMGLFSRKLGRKGKIRNVVCLGAEVTKTMSSVLRMKDGEVGGGDDLRKQKPEGVRPLGQQGEKKRKVTRRQ